LAPHTLSEACKYFAARHQIATELNINFEACDRTHSAEMIAAIEMVGFFRYKKFYMN